MIFGVVKRSAFIHHQVFIPTERLNLSALAHRHSVHLAASLSGGLRVSIAVEYGFAKISIRPT